MGDEPEKEAAEASPEESATEPAVSAVDQTQEIPAVSLPEAEAALEAVEPEAVDPEAVEPEAVDPEAVEPEAIEPDPVELVPEAESEPETTEPETTEPETTEPEAVDPEAGEQPSTEAEAVEAVGEVEAETPTDSDEGPAHARPRRSGWRTAVLAVGAVLAVAAAAVAGVVVGRSTAPGPDIVVQSEPVVAESSGAEAMPAAETLPTLTVAGSRPARATAVLTAAPGLADTPGTATGYRLVNAGISGGQVAAILASTFGAVGTPVESDGAWTVGDAGAASLQVTSDPLYSWRFEDPVGLASPAFGQQLEPGEAIELANAILSGIGVDVSAVDWQVDIYADRTTAIAWQLVTGQRTQLSWQLSFDPDGAVIEASGFSAGLEPVLDYPVVGAATAVSRLSTAPWWTLAPTLVDGPTVIEDPVPSASGSASPSPTSSPTPSPTSTLSSSPVASATPVADRPSLVVPVADVTVTGAELGLTQYWQPDGTVLMLPSYTVTGEDGSTWSVLAVDDAYVQFVDRPERSESTS